MENSSPLTAAFPPGGFLTESSRSPASIANIRLIRNIHKKIIPTKENIYTCKAVILRLYFILKDVKTVQSYVGDPIWTRNNGNKTKEYRIKRYTIKESKGHFCLWPQDCLH